MDISPESLQAHIPFYLTQPQKEGLVRALNSFPDHFEYYCNLHFNEMLQGDGWAGLDVIQFETGARDKIKGIVLSNSCDIAPDNKRSLPANVVFAPIIRLSKYRKCLLASAGK